MERDLQSRRSHLPSQAPVLKTETQLHSKATMHNVVRWMVEEAMARREGWRYMRKCLPHCSSYADRVTHWNELLARHIAKCGDSSAGAARTYHEEAKVLQELRTNPSDLPPTLMASTAPWLPSFLHEHAWSQQERTRLARGLAAHWMHARPLQYILQNVQFNRLLLRTRAPVLIPRWGKAVMSHLWE
jgi:hypothetical protein